MPTKPTSTPRASWPFDQAKADLVCDLVAEGQNLHIISKLKGFPSRAQIYAWMDANPDFSDKYARARADRADWRAARIDSITAKLLQGEIDPGAARVAIDAEKWQAGKEKPKEYGDKQTVEHSGTDGKAIQLEVEVKYGK